MIIVFEGADRTGKSTLAKDLAKQLKWPLFTPPRMMHGYKENAELYYNAVNKAVLEVCKTFDNFIVDRFFISDFVYSRFFGRKQCLDVQDVKMIDSEMLVVLAEASFEDQIARGFEIYSDDSEIQKILFRSYQDLYAKDLGSNFKFLSLNTSKMDQKECMARIKIAVQKFKKA